MSYDIEAATLLDKLRRAFGRGAPVDLVFEPPQQRDHYLAARRFSAVLWQDIPDWVVQQHPTALSLMTVEAFARLLPAFLRCALHDWTGETKVIRAVTDALSLQDRRVGRGEDLDHLRVRSAGMTRAQKRVVVAFPTLVARTPYFPKCFKLALQALPVWKQLSLEAPTMALGSDPGLHAVVKDRQFCTLVSGNAHLPALVQDMAFDERSLERASLPGLHLPRAYFARVNFAGADLRGAKLRGANLEGANLDGADFSGADLRSVNMAHASANGALFIGGAMKNIYAPHVALAYADLSRADLRGANLTAADLSNASMRHCSLANATLQRANLEDTDIASFRLQDVDVRDTCLAPMAEEETDGPLVPLPAIRLPELRGSLVDLLGKPARDVRWRIAPPVETRVANGGHGFLRIRLRPDCVITVLVRATGRVCGVRVQLAGAEHRPELVRWLGFEKERPTSGYAFVRSRDLVLIHSRKCRSSAEIAEIP